MHPGQVTVTVETVRALIGEQFPAWAELPISAVGSHGTVNAVFRIGDGLAARFPLVAEDVDVVRGRIVAEAAAALELVGATRFATPQPVAIGEPGAGFPMPWSVQSWLPGTDALAEDPGSSVAFAHDLAEFVSDVRSIDVRGRAFSGEGRGGDLRDHDDWVAECLEQSTPLLDVPRLTALWHGPRGLPGPDAPDVMSHGDLMPGNVLVDDGRLVGVLDVGGLGPADSALDLVGVWHLLDASTRDIVRRDLGCTPLEWARGRAWAFVLAIGLVWYYDVSNPVMAAIGRRTLERVVADPG